MPHQIDLCRGFTIAGNLRRSWFKTYCSFPQSQSWLAKANVWGNPPE